MTHHENTNLVHATELATPVPSEARQLAAPSAVELTAGALAVQQAEAAPTPHQSKVSESAGPTTNIFEQARQRTKKFSKEFIVNLVNDKLRVRTLDGSQGQYAYQDKIYFDQIQATPAEHDFASNPEAVTKVHDELADLIRDELTLHIEPTADKGYQQRAKAHLDTVKSEYQHKLEDDKGLVRKFVQEIADPANRRVRSPSSALEFSGLTIDVPDGKGGAKSVDLMRKTAGGVRPNMMVQEELGQTFVHWSSPEYMQERMEGAKPELTSRIYLNPREADSVAIFREIIEGAKEQGLIMKCKIFDRSADGMTHMRLAQKGEKFSSRADGILLYAGKDTDRLAALASEVYARHAGSFKGRGNSFVPYRIDDGFAIGDEPVNSGGQESLTTNRLDAISEARDAARRELGLQSGENVPAHLEDQLVAAFERHWDPIARGRGIDPNNMAFNLSGGQEAATRSRAVTQAEQAVAAATPEDTTARERQFATRQLTKALGKKLGQDPARDERLRSFLEAAEAAEVNTLEDFSRIAGEVAWVKQHAVPEGTPESEIPKAVYQVYKNSVRDIQQKAAAENRRLTPEEQRTIVRATLYADLQGMPPLYTITPGLQQLGTRRAQRAKANQGS